MGDTVPRTFPRGDNYEIMTLTKFKNLLQNHWANDTKHHWEEVCSNEGPCPFPRGDNSEIAKIHWRNLKNSLLQKYWANFIQTWHKASLGEGSAINFKQIRTISFLKKEILSFFFLDQHYSINKAWHKCIYWLELFLRWVIWPMGLLLAQLSLLIT